jgi:thioredoxin reductase (NADPH)
MLDCLVIGGGPAGLTAAVYLARYRRSLRVIDGGESRAMLIPTTHNYPGFKGIGGPELLQRLRQQASQYEVFPTPGVVSVLRIDSESAFLADCNGEEIQARAVILATGLVDKKPLINIRGGDPREVIRYCPVCDGFEASDRKVAVLGGDEAAKKAAFLRTFTQDVVWFTDRPISETTSEGIACRGHAHHIEVSPTGVEVVTADGNRHHADLLYPALGCEVRSGLATALGARCTEIGTLLVDQHQQTTVAGLYAIGDVVSDLHQLAVATGHAAVAATAVQNRLPRNLR